MVVKKLMMLIGLTGLLTVRYAVNKITFIGILNMCEIDTHCCAFFRDVSESNIKCRCVKGTGSFRDKNISIDNCPSVVIPVSERVRALSGTEELRKHFNIIVFYLNVIPVKKIKESGEKPQRSSVEYFVTYVTR